MTHTTDSRLRRAAFVIARQCRTPPLRVIAGLAIATAVVVPDSAASLTAGRADRPPVSKTAPIQSAASPCARNVAQTLSSTKGSRQLIVVEGANYGSSHADLSAWRLSGRCWRRQFGPWPARIGYAGFSDHKREGDGATPIGFFTIGPELYGNAPNPGVRFPFHRLVCGDWWDEDPSTPRYNEFVHLACGMTPPFGGDSEALWQETLAYPIFAVVEYNSSPVVTGRGSAIFIHADVGGPTSGCISVPLSELDNLLRWLVPRDRPAIAMGPASSIARL